MADRCGLTELLVDQCGCRNHRAGQTADEEITTERARLLATPGWMAAQYPGICSRCGTGFGRGTAIAMERGLGWRGECCGEVRRG